MDSPARDGRYAVSKEFAEIGGLRTHFWRGGSGPTLLMLHGQVPGSCVAVEWGDHVQRFAQAGFSVYAPDVAGFGRTENPVDHSVANRTRHIQAFVEHFGFGRYSIWGSSMGGYMGCAIALEDKRVENLVLMPSSLLPPPLEGPPVVAPVTANFNEELGLYKADIESGRRFLRYIISRKEIVTDELVRLFVENSTGKNMEAQQGRVKAGPPKPLYPELHKLRNRTLLLWGADDSPERALLLQRIIPGAELHMMQNCLHWPQVEYADRAFELVRDFLTQKARG